MKIVYIKQAARDLAGLPLAVQRRISKKMRFFALVDNPLDFAETLTDRDFGHYRFRIGDHRVIFDVVKDKIVIIKIARRDEVYR